MTVALIVLIVVVTAGAIAQANKQEQVKCPVCGLSFDKAKAAGSTTYKGQTFYFESKTDLDAFQKSPERFAK
jgi:YHS domain-containing protein